MKSGDVLNQLTLCLANMRQAKSEKEWLWWHDQAMSYHLAHNKLPKERRDTGVKAEDL